MKRIQKIIEYYKMMRIGLSRFLRKHVYLWHRRLSLVIAIPVFLWAISGFMHPLMTNIKPKIGMPVVHPKPVEQDKIQIGLSQLLQQYDIKYYHRFRLISIDTNWFYQIQTTPESKPLYYSTTTGKGLVNGDELYAHYLAGLFLGGKSSSASKEETKNKLQTETTDCCEAAAVCIKSQQKNNPVLGIQYIQTYNDEYKEINRLIPVYRVAFQRKDGIRIYVETTSDRMAYATDDMRAGFDQLFSILHNWAWMDALGDIKYILMALILGCAILSTLMGLYIMYITKKAVKNNENPLLQSRYRHRKVSLLGFTFTLFFTFSGTFHALEKVNAEKKSGFITPQHIVSDNRTPDLKIIQKLIDSPLTNISAVLINDSLFWQVYTPQSIEYINASNYAVIKNGDEQFAAYLAKQFSLNNDKSINKREKIIKFGGEYGFINKRLPVWKISYTINDNERYYIETSSGYMAAYVQDKDLWEGLSFAYLHKHHFMDWGGKILRDISTMFWAFVQIALIATGIILYIRRWRRVKDMKPNV
ncbi:MAG: PepSY domain-containing protein [Bacteroidota bacterium]